MGPLCDGAVALVNNNALLVVIDHSIDHNADNHAAAQPMLDELTQLVRSIGLRVVGAAVVRLRQPTARLLLGSGKAQQISAQAQQLHADCIVFDDELSATQQRNWEQLTGVTVIDRHQVILDIFQARAATREATLQVELARLQYQLPRLTRAWTHLSRQQGGARGTRGEGEKQLEKDRRTALRRITRVQGELQQLGAQRATMSRRRHAVPVPSGALVGYTNAGKSSLLRALTGADVLVADKLFATLDPTTRRLELPGGMQAVLTDTVGFVRKLPHDLVNAFHSTLEETTEADFLIHVLDASDPQMLKHYQTTRSVLQDIGAGETPVLLAFNKMDRVADRDILRFAHHRFAAENVVASVEVSAHAATGLEQLIAAIESVLASAMPRMRYRLPSNRHDLAALIHRTGSVLRQEYHEQSFTITARVPERTHAILEQFLISG